MNEENTDHAREVPERREAKNGSLRHTIIATLPGFILTGVVGTMLGA
jgi:hypothetical protein